MRKNIFQSLVIFKIENITTENKGNFMVNIIRIWLSGETFYQQIYSTSRVIPNWMEFRFPYLFHHDSGVFPNEFL